MKNETQKPIDKSSKLVMKNLEHLTPNYKGPSGDYSSDPEEDDLGDTESHRGFKIDPLVVAKNKVKKEDKIIKKD